MASVTCGLTAEDRDQLRNSILSFRVWDTFTLSLHCALSLAAQCIVIGPVCGERAGGVCGCVCGSVTTITRNCVHRSSPNWVCR